MTNEEQNVKQKAFWSGKGGDVWVERQDELDITLKPLGDAALKKIDLSNCNKILDIGCGTGRTTLDIASEHVNSKVSGLDISLPMLVHAKSLAANENISNAEFIVQDVQFVARPDTAHFAHLCTGLFLRKCDFVEPRGVGGDHGHGQRGQCNIK